MDASGWKRIAIESPYKGDVARNEQFARNLCHYAVTMKCNPYAMHLFFTQFLSDNSDSERDIGIACGLEWTALCEEVWFCLRRGEHLSSGMQKALRLHRGQRPVRFFFFTQEGIPLEEVDDFAIEGAT
jgi:hypothetical protein